MWNIGPPSRRHPGIWALLDKPSARPSRIYIEHVLTEPHQLAFESPDPNEGHRANPPPVPYRSSIQNGLSDDEYRSPWDSDLDEDYLYSSAALCGVTKVAFCRGEADGIPGCVLGILLTTGMGARGLSAVSVRISLIRSSRLLAPRGLSFRMSKWKNVVEATLSTVDEVDELVDQVDRWVKVPWYGTLVWWFSSYRCEISHEVDDEL